MHATSAAMRLAPSPLSVIAALAAPVSPPCTGRRRRGGACTCCFKFSSSGRGVDRRAKKGRGASESVRAASRAAPGPTGRPAGRSPLVRVPQSPGPASPHPPSSRHQQVH